MLTKRFHIQASQYIEERRKAEALRIGKVVNFLREHPLSTAEEVFKGCGVSPMAGCKYVYSLIYKGKRVWRLNHRKLKVEGLE